MMMFHARLALRQMAAPGPAQDGRAEADDEWRALAATYHAAATREDWTFEEALSRPLVVQLLSRAMDLYMDADTDNDPGDHSVCCLICTALDARLAA
jgi:hypothetical protein